MGNIHRKLGTFILALALCVGLAPIPPAAYAQPADLPNGQAQNQPARQIATRAQPASSFAGEGAAAIGASGNATDGILVQLEKQAADQLSLRSLESTDVYRNLEQNNLHVTDQTRTHDGTVVLSVEPDEGQSDTQAAEAARALQGVASVQPNYVYLPISPIEDAHDGETANGGNATAANAADASASPAPADAAADSPISAASLPLANDPYAQILNPEEEPNQYWLAASGANDAWSLATTDNTVTIAFFDSGVMGDHEDLKANVLADQSWDAYYKRPLDTSILNGGDNGGHGTHVAGIAAAATNNAKGIAGISFNANILAVKVVDDSAKQRSTTRVLVTAYEYLFDLIDSGQRTDIRVVNISMGGYGDAANDQLLHDTIATARAKYGIATVCAGGNGNNVVAYTEPSYPCDFDECIAVTALQADGANAVWSDYNEYKDISAPGCGIWSASATAAQTPQGTPYSSKSGTSMAAPMVSGALALLFAAAPDATVDEACAALYETAAPVTDPENDRSQTSGSHGALDVEAALSFLLENRPEPQPQPQFADVAEGDWFFGPVSYVVSHGIMNGYAGTALFGPNDLITREQAACVLYNYLGEGRIFPAAPQSDIDQTEWYAKGVNWAVATKAMNGYSDAVFGVGDTLTREQLACILANIAADPGAIANPDRLNTLPDRAQISDWAMQNMIWAVGNGIINGFSAADGTRWAMPQKGSTRAEMAGVVANALQGGFI